MFSSDNNNLTKSGKERRKKSSLAALQHRAKTVTVVQDDGDGNWLVSYADLMTLLFGFFVILSSMSTPNAEKIEKLKQATSESMGGTYQKPFEELSKGIKAVLKEIDLEKEVTVVETEEGVTIVSKGTLFFDSGAAELRPQAVAMVDRLTGVLAKQAAGFRIFVEGHTDDTPINSKSFPSNWELSSARAGTVVRLLENKGFSGSDLRPIGLADKEPLLPNRSVSGEAIPLNQAENRRIVIRLQRKMARSEKK
jgi:chemotaxis protein MotB